MKHILITFIIILAIQTQDVLAQVIINEASNRNLDQVLDEDGENNDWLEIYNTSDSPLNMEGWTLTDNKSIIDKWTFPSLTIEEKDFQLIYASGKDRKIVNDDGKWETAIFPTDEFRYMIPNASTSSSWKNRGFDSQNWSTGQAGFGYGDNDDVTIIPEGTLSVYILKTFNISASDVITQATCHVDYDDGFVAYLNGTEICRGNMDGTPLWNTTPGNHNAGSIETFDLDMNVVQAALVTGENVFAIEVHNTSKTSSDLSLIPYLSFKTKGTNTYFRPAWGMLSNIEGNKLHTNFKIATAGETLYLFNAQQQFVDSLELNRIDLNYSIGHSTDGSGIIAIFTNASPGTSNNSSTAFTNGYESMPTFSHEAGFYESEITLTISNASENAQVRYTRDGSEPTMSSPLLDGDQISISSTTTIRARSFGAGDKLPSAINTATFFIDEEFSIPVLSVTTNRENLWGTNGIFSNTSEEWNKPCYVEYFDETKALAFRQAAGIQVDGGAGGSRTKPQTSFRIEPDNGTFGDGVLKYKLQPDRPNRDNYESFYMRNGSNQYLQLPYKDACQVKGMGKNTHSFYSAYRPAIAFINGEYYGMYEVREKINADYLASNYGMDTDSMDMVGISHFKAPRTILPIVGSSDPFFADWETFLSLNPSSPTYLEEVGKILDLDNYTDYIAGQTWMTNKDWPHNNMKAWRCKGSDMRWQFAIMDLEWSFLPTNTRSNLATTPDFDQTNYMLNLGTQWPSSGFWFKLMQNTTYKNHFLNRISDLMNTSYAYSVLSKIEYDMYKEMLLEMPDYFKKWGNGDIYSLMSSFSSDHTDFSNQLSIRTPYVRAHLENHYDLSGHMEIELNVQPKEAGKIKISTIVPDSYPWQGIYFKDVEIQIEAIPNPGYVFSHWDNSTYISDLTSAIFNSEIDDNTSFTANFTKGEISFEGVTISEIFYKDGEDFKTSDWFEIYNSTDQKLYLKDWYFTDKNPENRFNFSEFSIVSPNSRLVVAKNLDAFRKDYGNVTNVVGGFDFGLGSPSDEINLYNAEGELQVSVSYSDLYPWALHLEKTGRTLELIDPNRDLNDPSNWFAGCIAGSPGTAYSKCIEDPTGTGSLKISSSISDIQAYPVPVSGDELNLKFSLEKSVEFLRLDIYSLLGTKLMSKEIYDTKSGDKHILVDVSDLKANQMYIISVSSDSFHKTIKIITE